MFQWVGPSLSWILPVCGLILFLGGATQIIIKNRELVRAGQDWFTPSFLTLLSVGMIYLIITK